MGEQTNYEELKKEFLHNEQSLVNVYPIIQLLEFIHQLFERNGFTIYHVQTHILIISFPLFYNRSRRNNV